MAAAKRKRSKKSGARKGMAKRSGGKSLEARVTKLEKNQKVIVGVLEQHQRALVGGGLLEARAARKGLGAGRKGR